MFVDKCFIAQTMITRIRISDSKMSLPDKYCDNQIQVTTQPADAIIIYGFHKFCQLYAMQISVHFFKRTISLELRVT